MNIIVISLERAKERRDRIKSQLSELNIDAVIMDAVDSQNLTESEKNKKIYLPNGYRFGDTFKPGEIACTMSHTKALKLAKEKNWPHLIVLEDDVILAEDFEKRVKFLFRIAPPNWEHIYLSGIPRLGFSPVPNLQFANVVPTIFTECTHSMIIRNTSYDKVIEKLSLFETTTDDMYNSIIDDKKLISYTYYPFVTYASDDFTYIWDKELQREHKSKLFFVNNI
jgi:GR25 family glycosyltransferase involved in LPS biosynthesis